jgi:hypothetical protein
MRRETALCESWLGEEELFGELEKLFDEFKEPKKAASCPGRTSCE